MTKDDIDPITDLGNFIRQFIHKNDMMKIMEGSEKISEANAEGVALWLKGAIKRLDTIVDTTTKIKIMEQCGFNCATMNYNHIEKAIVDFKQYASLDDYIEAKSHLDKDNNKIIHIHRPFENFGVRCFCSLWRGLPENETVPLTWCHCSKGYLTKHWEGILGRPPKKVELQESCISGANQCKFVVHI